jgi:hypothetical protein
MKEEIEMEEELGMEGLGPIVATESTPTDDAIAELDRRIRAMETAIGDLRSVKASEMSTGRKTVAASSMAAKGGEPQVSSVDEALRSLSVEQRIAVKSGLMRAGLLS